VITVRFEGGSELAKTLATLSQRVSKKIQREALVDAAEPMRARMARLAPFEPGKPDLRDAMVISNARGTDVQETAVAVGPSKAGFYGSFLELGTKFLAARPFARPAFDELAPTSLGIIGAAMWTALAARGIRRSSTVEAPVQSGGGSGLL
jgi:HK97 gp10 family phage protein